MVADPRQKPAVGLVEGGEAEAERLIEAHVPAPGAGVGVERRGQVRVDPATALGEGLGVEQTHVHPLPQLGTGGMGGVAEHRQPLGDGTRRVWWP